MSLNSTYRRALLDFILGRTEFVPPATIYLGLTMNEPDVEDGDFTEIEDPSYVRFTLTNDKDSWTAAADGDVANKIEVSFPTATENWNYLGVLTQYFILTTHPTSTTSIFAKGILQTPLEVLDEDTVRFAPGTLILSLESLPEYGIEV